jgi:hypothetical protein
MAATLAVIASDLVSRLSGGDRPWAGAAAGFSDASGILHASEEDLPYAHIEARQQDDLEALDTFRPGYTFWQNVFTNP